jgi:hypothetical protein
MIGEEETMKKGIVILLAVLVLFSAVAVPSDAWAWRGHGCCWGGWWWPGAFFGGLALGAALSYPYPYYYPYPQAPVIYEQPAAYVQQPPTHAAPPTPAVQREVVFATGKYVLYGDGMSQPWRWVWVDAVPPVPAPPPQR